MDAPHYIKYKMRELVNDLQWLEQKIKYDRESNLTHSQRNWNDDYNRDFLEKTRKKISELIENPDGKNSNIPF